MNDTIDSKVILVGKPIIRVIDWLRWHSTVKIYLDLNRRYACPAYHIKMDGQEAMFDFKGRMLEGEFTRKQRRFVKKFWLEKYSNKAMKGWYFKNHQWHWGGVVKPVDYPYDFTREPKGKNDYYEAIQIHGVCVCNERFLELWFGDGSHKYLDVRKLPKDVYYFWEEEEYQKVLNDDSLFSNISFYGSAVIWNDEVDIGELGCYIRGVEIK